MPSHLRFRIFEDFSFVISDHDLLVVMIKNVSWVDRNFAASPWCIDDELRYSVAGRVTPETFDDLDPFCHGGSEVSRPVDEVTLIDIVRADAAHHEFMNKCPHHGQIVIYPFQEHALVSERYSMVDEALESCPHLGGQLAGMVDVNAHPEGMKFLEHPAQLRCDPLRQENWDTCADPDKLYVFDGAQTAQNPAEFIVGKEQGISTGKQDVSNFSVIFQISISFLKIGVQLVFANATHHAAPGAIATI